VTARTEQHLSARIDASLAGQRLDQALAAVFGDFSRSRLQQWLREGRVRVDGRVPRGRDRVTGGEQVELDALLEPQGEVGAEDIPLVVVHQDQHLLVIDKPADLVVHPAAGNWEGTLQNALLHADPGLAVLPRSGIVHRLDKDTSGLLVVARTLVAHRRLVEALQAREIKREYRAIVSGVVVAGGTVEAPIGRHPTARTRMAVTTSGKPAITHYRVLERFRAHSYLRVNLETGRTHQIRVHLAHLRHPIVGDPVYGGRPRLPPRPSDQLVEALRGFGRQALHAHRLGLAHPVSGEWLEWESPVPPDMQALLAALRADAETTSARP
jgi:23S rRNA pseudouridine1911/1915/1917 synthase